MPINWLKRKRAKRLQRFTLLESLKELAFLMYRHKGTNFFYCANIFDKNYFLCAFFMPINWLKRKRAKRWKRFTLLESLKELVQLMCRHKGTNFFYCANIFDKNYFLCAFFIVLIINALSTFNYF